MSYTYEILLKTHISIFLKITLYIIKVFKYIYSKALYELFDLNFYNFIIYIWIPFVIYA